jgi:hypothetical protein
VVPPHHQLGLDAVDVRALVLDDAVVAGLERAVSLDRDDRVGLDARGDRDGLERAQKGWLGDMLSTAVASRLPESCIAKASRLARSSPVPFTRGAGVLTSRRRILPTNCGPAR